MAKLPLGKLKPDLLEKLFARHFNFKDDRLVIGPRVGEDAAIIDLGDRYLVAKTDPVTFATKEIGWYAVNINANDLAVRGAKPRWFQSVVLLPEKGATSKLADKIFAQIAQACSDLDISVAGGHTEVTYDLPRPIVIGSMLGEVAKDKLVTTAGAQVGDDIIITKGIVVEGTALIAREKAEELKARGYKYGWIKEAQDYLFNPGLSVVTEALLSNSTVKVHSMHDPTEGGLANGLFEVAYASGTGLMIDYDAIPILPHSLKLCEEFGLDPFGTLTSGTLILTLAPTDTSIVLKAFEAKGIKAARIGRVVEKEQGLKVKIGTKLKSLRYSEKDEILRILS
jgi:hydrogenase expression/formation protein HypE